MADFRVMLPLAAAMVDKVLQNGEYKHGDSWVTELISFHLDHARGHQEQHESGQTFDDTSDETHISHLAVRALMALELQLRGIEVEKREKRKRMRRIAGNN